MKTQIAISEIKCLRRTYHTHGPNRQDEIYLIFYVLLMKLIENKKSIFHQVSKAKIDFKKNVEWVLPINVTLEVQDFPAFAINEVEKYKKENKKW